VSSHPSFPRAPNGFPVQTACPVCRASNPAKCPPGRDRLFGLVHGTFALSRCSSCGCIFQNPVPEKSALARFYPREYWWSENTTHVGRSAHFFRKLEKAYREFVTRDHVRFLNSCVRENPHSNKLLLDIGCGNGTFLHLARLHGFDPHGMDVSDRAVEIAQQQYGLKVRQGEIGSKIWNGCRFDFITMFHVLEHLPDPRLGLKYARELLQPGGVLILQVPNLSSLQARLFGARWYGLDVPRHVINYTPKALGHLLRDAGFGYRLSSRFSLRDNPASIASSLVPWLDPIHRKGMELDSSPALGGAIEIAYFGLVLLSVPAALFESACGVGGTIWACAKPK